MYWPFFVLPYQREPFLWYTPDAVLIQTIPAPLSAGLVGLVPAEGVCIFEEVAFGAAAMAVGDQEAEAAEWEPAGAALT